MDPQQPPLERNEKDNDADLSNTEFSFKYTESGGNTNRYLLSLILISSLFMRLLMVL
jgi:hypothetical protein